MRGNNTKGQKQRGGALNYIFIRPREAAPRRSWWVGLSREQFSEAAKAEEPRMRGEQLPRAVQNYFDQRETRRPVTKPGVGEEFRRIQ